MKRFMLIVGLVVALAGCTDNQRAKNWGGNATIKKPDASWQLVVITWKNSNMWVLWFDPKTNKCHFREDSSYGVVEGQVTVEKCDPLMFKP